MNKYSKKKDEDISSNRSSKLNWS